MIYPPDKLSRLPPLPNDIDFNRPTLWNQGMVGYAIILISVILAPLILIAIAIFILVIYIDKLVSYLKGINETDSNSNWDGEEEEAPRYIESTYDEKTGWLQIRMNKEVFDEFVSSLINSVKPRTLHGGKIERAFSFELGNCDEFEGLAKVLYVSSGTDGFKLHAGNIINVSGEIAEKAFHEWAEVSKRDEPALIVLDRYQRRWCTHDSSGRLTIEYIPNRNLIAEFKNDENE